MMIASLNNVNRNVPDKQEKKSGKRGRPTHNAWDFLRHVPPTRKWLSDSGSSDHICGNRDWFTEYHKFKEPIRVETVASHVKCPGFGTVRVEAYINTKWRPLVLENVLYVPGAWNLFSVDQFLKKLDAVHHDWYLRNTYDEAYYLNETTREWGPTAVRNDRRYTRAQFMVFRAPQERKLKASQPR